MPSLSKQVGRRNILTARLYNPHPFTDKLVAAYTFEESGTYFDHSGLGNHPTNVNGVTQVAGKVGNAGGFASASTQYLAVNSNSYLAIGNRPFTLEGWVYTVDRSVYQIIASKYNSQSGSREWLFDIFGGAGARVRFGVYHDAVTFNTVEAANFGTIPNSTWIHVICWYDPTAGTINIEANGTAETPVAHTGGIYAGTAQMRIGSSTNSSGNPGQSLNGQADELRIWKRIFSSSQRAWLRNGGNGRTLEELKAYTENR